ncbi:MAG: serine/threonine-protein kinase [Pseudomonadota bacterium]
MIDPMPGDIFQTGQVLNNTYEIMGVLGRGGTGEVYLARNRVVGREVAIKALNSEFSGNSDYVELMKREEEIRDIVHDAVVRYSECSMSDQNHVFLVMEYVDGASLNDVMMDRRIEERELLIIAHRVLEGLQEVHRGGIVHRDLSPDNIILRGGDPERATIIDFGIAKDTATGARTIVGNDFAGKYEYAAPEQLEGRAEYRTDLYSLGASLLAASRREIPFPGATPGEIIRRKQEPLDTSGLGEGLAGLVDWLAAPALEDRPRDAREALARVDSLLKPSGQGDTSKRGRHDRGGKNPGKTPKRKGGLGWVLGVPVALAAIAGGLWFSGALDGLFVEPLPLAQPYELSANIAPDGTALLTSHAPDDPAAAAIRAGFEAATGAAAPEEAVTLAEGVPSPDWPAQVSQLMGLAQQLENWDLTVRDTTASLSGLASSAAARAAIEGQLQQFGAGSGFRVVPEVIAGPRVLSQAAIQAALAPLGTCGPLSVTPPEGGTFPLFETITVRGDLAARADGERIAQALEPVIGDRNLRLDTTLLNGDLCAIRAVLPAVDSSNLSIWLGNGATGAPSLTGVFRTNENPVVEVHVPEAITQGSLWVMVVDNTGKVFHVLPNVNRTDHSLAQLGTVANGVRQVRVLFSVEEFLADNSRLAMRVNESDYGKSEVIAILSRSNLFDLRRPRDESVTSVADALAEALAGRSGEIIGVASRIIDARP